MMAVPIDTYSKRSDVGFSLVELAVVMVVMSILATAFTPSFVAATQNKLVERVAKDIAALQDAASYYFTQSMDEEGRGHWPGFSTACTPETGGQGREKSAVGELMRKGYLANMDALRDPWGGYYSLGVLQNTEGCSLQIKTQPGSLPKSAEKYLKALSANSHFESVETAGGRKSFLVSTVPTPLATSIAMQDDSGEATFSTGIISAADDNYVGKNRKCFAYTHEFNGPCRGDWSNCRYEADTGNVLGARSGGCLQIKCAWVCFD